MKRVLSFVLFTTLLFTVSAFAEDGNTELPGATGNTELPGVTSFVIAVAPLIP